MFGVFIPQFSYYEFCYIQLRDTSAEVKKSSKTSSEDAQALLHSKEAEIFDQMD